MAAQEIATLFPGLFPFEIISTGKALGTRLKKPKIKKILSTQSLTDPEMIKWERGWGGGAGESDN